MNSSDLQLLQVEQTLAPYTVKRSPPPAAGWLRALREGLGMTTRQAAARAGITQSSWVQAERREAAGAISLGQLRRLGAALDCELSYALVPTLPLRARVEAQAEAVARRQVASVAHSMALEAQGTDDAYTRAQVEDLKRDLLRGRRSRLWD